MSNIDFFKIYNNPPHIDVNKNIISKYPFNPEIITTIINIINNDKCSYIKLNNINVFKDDINYIDEIYFENKYNFINFIDNLAIKYKFTKKQKETALINLKNIKCIFCNINYTYFADNLINIYDIDNNIDITDNLCYDCIIKDYKCNKCKIVLNEPYQIIYTSNKDKKYFLCKTCFEIKKL